MADYTKGLICPGCLKYNYFRGARISPDGDQLNYTCECGFHASLLVPSKNYIVEYRFIREQGV
jgi:hypothetical protein